VVGREGRQKGRERVAKKEEKAGREGKVGERVTVESKRTVR
jgi:hypothetical protein